MKSRYFFTFAVGYAVAFAVIFFQPSYSHAGSMLHSNLIKIFSGLKFKQVHNAEKDFLSKSDSSTKMSLVIYFAGYCPYCKENLPQITSNYDRYKSCGVQIFGVSTGEAKEPTAKALSEWKIKFPVIQDEDKKIGKAVGVDLIPTAMLTDKDGIVVEVGAGSTKFKKVIEKMKKQLKESGCAQI